MDINQIAKSLGMSIDSFTQGTHSVTSPIDGKSIGHITLASIDEANTAISQAQTAFLIWREIPAPKRGELIRIFAEVLRQHKQALGALVTLECGKIYQEGLGEVQEMIDICDFAVGLSRQLYDLTIASERPQHKMLESWQPIGPIGIISAFNFPVAVWAWNAALAIICGNSIIWKPSEKTPLTAIACQKLLQDAINQTDGVPDNLSQVILGDADIGQHMAADKRIPVISATGSTRMGRKVAPVVAERFGRSILELGGNNAIIVGPTANMNMALRAIVFGAVGTAGQRCTSTRRLLIHKECYASLVSSIKKAYQNLKVGNPFEANTLVGPLIDKAAFESMQSAIQKAKTQGGKVFGGEREDLTSYENGYYVRPAIIEMPTASLTVQDETFAPILYIYSYSELSQAIELHNRVPQG